MAGEATTGRPHCRLDAGDGSPTSCAGCTWADTDPACYPVNPERDPLLEAVLAWNFAGLLRAGPGDATGRNLLPHTECTMLLWLAFNFATEIKALVKEGKEDHAWRLAPLLLDELGWVRRAIEELEAMLNELARSRRAADATRSSGGEAAGA